MKFWMAVAWSCTAALAQTPPAPPPVGVTPGSPSVQAPAPPAPKISPDTVVATVKGQPVTAAEIESMLAGFPAQVRQSYAANPREIVRQFMVFRYIAGLAEKAKLDQESPIREQLAFARSQVLWQAEIKAVTDELNRLPEDLEKYYNDHKDRYTQARVKAVYIPFSDDLSLPSGPGAKKPASEAEAKVKAEAVAKQAREGADFVQLVKDHSEDATSQKAGGDLPPMKKTDAVPEPLRSIIFSMKKGEISAPVRHTNGYYVFRCEEMNTQPLAEVKDEIFQELKSERMRQWMQATEKEADVRIENEAFFTPSGKAQ